MLTPLEEALRRRLRSLTQTSRARLLRFLNLPTAEPVTLIEALYTDSEFLALRHFLTDLEEDLPTLAAVVAELRRMERDEYLHSLGSGRWVASTPAPESVARRIAAGGLATPRMVTVAGSRRRHAVTATARTRPTS